jgi:Mg2+ and Co2+ transporter CorA
MSADPETARHIIESVTGHCINENVHPDPAAFADLQETKQAISADILDDIAEEVADVMEDAENTLRDIKTFPGDEIGLEVLEADSSKDSKFMNEFRKDLADENKHALQTEEMVVETAVEINVHITERKEVSFFNGAN